MSISTQDILDAVLLSEAAYLNSDGLRASSLNVAGWHVLGSDPIPSGPLQGHELPAPAGLSLVWDTYFGEGAGDSNFLYDNGNVQAFVAINEFSNTIAIAFRGTDTIVDNIQNIYMQSALDLTKTINNLRH